MQNNGAKKLGTLFNGALKGTWYIHSRTKQGGNEPGRNDPWVE